MKDIMYMKHSTVEGTARTTRAAFEKVWEPKGWVEVDASQVAASEALGVEKTDLHRLTRPELDTVATGLGLDPSGIENKGALVDLIETTLQSKEP